MARPSLILNLALSQEDRSAHGPDPNKVRVDDRSLAHLISLAMAHGKLIHFYDLSNAPDGDWSALFASDPAMALATLASLDPGRIEQEMQALGRRLRLEDRPLVRPEPWRDLVALIRQLLTILGRRPLREGPLAAVLHQVEHPLALVDAATSLGRFLESTGLDLRLGTQPILLKDSELRRLENLLRDFLGVLLSELEVSRQLAERELRVELSRQGHAAHVALYIAFARLFQSLQARLNRFPASLLAFYHQQVLRQDAIADSAPRPDHLTLAFRLKPEASSVLVPRHTLFAAGVDGEGAPITFATDQDLEVQAAELIALRALRVQGRFVAVPGRQGSGASAMDAVWLTDFTLPLSSAAAGPLLPLFGATQPKTLPQGATRPGVLGFAVASPLLELAGGLRVARVTVGITAESLGAVRACLAAADPASALERIRHTLEGALSWEHTTAAGLAPLSARARLLPPGTAATAAAAIELVCTLPPSAPPWRACPPWGDQPLLLARLLVPDPAPAPGAVTPLTLLSLLALESLHLAVEVRDLPPTALHSSAGTLDPSQPLPLFGPSPVCGSFVSAAVAEIAAKPLEAITLRLDWHGLPISRDGFRGHYSGYRLDGDGQSHPPGELFADDVFRVALELDLETPAADGSTTATDLPLFQRAAPEGSAGAGSSPLAASSALTLAHLKGVTGARGLRLVLTAPPHAFGEALYAINCLDASRRLAAELQANPPSALSSDGPAAPLAWPNPPWCPKAASLRLDYRCATALPGAAATAEPPTRLWHLSPLDDLSPVVWPGGEGVRLLPDLCPNGGPPLFTVAPSALPPQEGTLLLTLSQPVQQLSLLFGLASAGTVDPLRSTPTLTVEGWADGEWLPLPENALQDGTGGLSRSGLLQLALPPERATSRLRLRVRGLRAPLPDLVCLEPNAVGATWQGPGGRQLLNRSLAAGTVTAPLVNLPAIADVYQPLPSSGGVAPASAALEQVRLAERLGHKERAIQPEDYALLLLSAFPFLWQVAVLPARNASGESAPGCVTLIPIPGPDSPTIADPTIPSCDAALGDRLLAELRSRVSPFVRLQVGSPPYCRITVCATVVVRDELRIATALQHLQSDLVRFLSPWPAGDLGERPKIYYDESAISQFVRDRSYIKSIDSIELKYSPENPPIVYYTSALRHELKVRPSSPLLASAADDMGGGR